MSTPNRLLTALVVAAAAVAGAVIAAPAAVATDACPGTAVFETDGYTAGLSLANWNASPFNQGQHPGVQIVQVPYQDGVFPVADHKALDEAVAGGVAALDGAVRKLHAGCPGAHLTLAGYSEGALVAGNEIGALARGGDIPHGQINGVLYGDPRRAFGDGGRGGVAGGIETNVPTILPGVTMQGPAGFGDIAVREVCNENDGICNSTNMITNLAAFANGLVGYRSGDHSEQAYQFDPLRDNGNGLTFHPQDPRIPYGAPIPTPAPVGTPWQIQQAVGDAPARSAVATARNGLRPLVPDAVWADLQQDPWMKLFNAA